MPLTLTRLLEQVRTEQSVLTSPKYPQSHGFKLKLIVTEIEEQRHKHMHSDR